MTSSIISVVTSMTKKERLQIILNIINSEEISTQEELTEKLTERGYDISQSTISRDINELNLIKTEGLKKKYKYIKAYATATFSAQHLAILKATVESVAFANNLIVIRTNPGSANTVAKIVDEFNFNNVLGSIAGDDTVLMVAVSNTDAEVITQKIREIIANA